MDSDRSVSAGAAHRGSASGWFSIDRDRIVRGWCRVKGREDQRLTVSIAIDARIVATIPADRLSLRLIELGEGDGRHAFACAIPDAFCDDAPHEVRVEIVTPDYGAKPLRSKQASFTLAPAAALPAVTLHRVGPEAIEGAVTGTAVREELDVWLDGRRLPEESYAVTWGFGDRQRLPFSLRMTDRAPSRMLTDDLVIGYPGVLEAGGGGAPLRALVTARVTPLGGGEHEVRLGSGLALPRGERITAQVRPDGEDAPILAQRTLRFTGNRACFALEDEASHPRMRLRLVTSLGAALGPDMPFTRGGMPRRLIGNGALVRWNDDGPDDFALCDDIDWERSFYAFPGALKREFRPSGNVLVVPLGPDGSFKRILRQDLRLVRAGGSIDLGLACLARASAPVLLTLRIVTADGEIRAGASTMLGQRWKHDRHVVSLAAGPDDVLHLELVGRVVAKAESAFLEVAGLHCGAPDLPDFADVAAEAPPPAGREGAVNLVVNADLVRWPEGLAPIVRGSRFELAEGWVLTGADAETGATIAALPAPDRAPGRYALALTLPHVAEPCRLDIALDVSDLAGTGELSFGARLGTLPPAEGASQVPSPWGVIDRIAIFRRQTYLDEHDATATLQRVSRVASRVVMTRAWDDYRFSFTTSDAADDRIDVSRPGEARVDYFLSFEFHHPVALAIHGASVRMMPEIAADPPAPLAFEDRAIRAQIDTLRGIDAWRSPAVLRPAVTLAPASADPEPLRWSWADAALGSVEVAICVHDAADETLACLASLVGASGVPHTVRIVDDGSGEDTRRRIATFVADKPWMTLVSNAANRGYTASANGAVRGSRADWVILLNSDTIVPRGWIEGLLAVAASDPGVALVGPVSNAATYQSVPELYDGTGKWAANPLPPGFTVAAMAELVAERSTHAFPEVPLLNGFCTLIRRSAFLAVDGFDEQAFPAGYGEENDLCLRISKAGWRLRVADHVFVYHVKSASFGTARRIELAKAGDRALRALHPDVDVGALGRRFLGTPALAALRAATAAAYPPRGAAPVERDA